MSGARRAREWLKAAESRIEKMYNKNRPFDKLKAVFV